MVPMTETEARDDREAPDEAARTVGDYEALDRAIGCVLFNVTNYPEAVQVRMLGQNTRPLTEKLIDAVIAAGYRKHPEPVREYAVAKETWPMTPIYRMRDRASAERHVASPPVGEDRKGWLAIQRDVIEPGPWVPVETNR